VTDQIVLKGISAKGFHGVLDFEKRDGQTFVVDVTMHVDLSAAGTSDDLADTVNYAEVAGDVVALIEGDSLDLIEALASRIADRVLARPLVEAVEVVVHKPEAPVGHPFTDVQVRVSRERQSQVVIAMGSNIGDSIETLHDAAISLYGLIDIIEVSPVVETDPVGGPDQPA
jgi:dihydroneopterin aldolase/2-amino-4-hydroxy-6-hydroxymethyldihydropteridine diphosphokinase